MVSGDLIHEARRRAGLTQRELAQRAGKAASVIGRWERGEVKPPLETVAELVRACGLELSFSLGAGDDGHDLSLIRQTLALNPEERFDRAVAAARFVLAGRQALTRDPVPG